MPLLIVEDDRANREALSRLLSKTGRIVHTAATVAEALKMLAVRPRAVVLDMQLPDGNGLTVLSTIRREKMGARVAVVTGSLGQEQRLPPMSESPDAIFIKPIRPTELIQWLDEVAPVVPPMQAP